MIGGVCQLNLEIEASFIDEVPTTEDISVYGLYEDELSDDQLERITIEYEHNGDHIDNADRHGYRDSADDDLVDKTHVNYSLNELTELVSEHADSESTTAPIKNHCGIPFK